MEVSLAVPEIRYLSVEPSNVRERAIAKLVDQIDLEGRLSRSTGAEVMAALDFMMSKADCKFLLDYIHWRMAHPIAK